MVVRAIYERQRTDKRLSVLWVVAIILVDIISVALSFVAMFWSYDFSDPYYTMDTSDFFAVGAVSNVAGVLSTILLAAFVYYLVKRQNDHYAREARLRTALLSLMSAAAWSPERTNDIVPETMALSMARGPQEKHRNVWFWIFVILLPTILSIVISLGLWLYIYAGPPQGDISYSAIIGALVLSLLMLLGYLILMLYLLYFLTQTMEEHDSRWNAFAYNVRRAMSKLGFPVGRSFRMNRLPEHSVALYVVLTIFTGIFIFYWYYVLVKDPNEHFDYQWEFEDNILSAIMPPEYVVTSSVSRP
ncbi:MAG: hypothetical protein A3K76_05700 [Euryarchaeota archaeon RBG_13_57_23]|nr:MAG: hypothetical protein A3K76_05700 [Euryarchaeota archaeon RBG_13_57_23]